MKKLISLFIFTLILSIGTNAAGITVTVATSDNANVPRILGEGSTLHDPPGVSIELLVKAAEQVGITLNIIRLPPKRVLEYLEKGEADAALIWSYSDERSKFAAYPMKKDKPDSDRRIYNVGYAVYKQKKSPVKWDGKQFSNLKNAIGARWSVSKDLTDMGLMVEEVKTHRQNLEKLKAGRIDAVVAPEEVIDFLISKDEYKNIEKIKKPFSEKPYFVIFNKHFKDKNSAIIEKLWDKIGIIRDKTIKELMPKYEKYFDEN